MKAESMYLQWCLTDPDPTSGRDAQATTVPLLGHSSFSTAGVRQPILARPDSACLFLEHGTHPDDAQEMRRQETATARPGTERMLIVDDERDIRESLQALIEAEFPQVNVKAVESGAAALEVMRKGPVDVVISDHRMPEMNGLELLDRIKRIAPKTRLGLISAYNDPTMSDHSSYPQLSFFLSKPIKVASFVAHTKRALKAG